MNEVAIIEFFSHYAYQPMFVYMFIVLFMTASSFGLPIPEEITLISAGLVGHMSMHPTKFPPPYEGAESVQLWVLCVVCFVAVLGSDVLIYMLGKIFGRRILESQFFKKRIGTKSYERINKIFQKYGHWGSGLFRFTPGFRFPGHMSCGIMGVPLWKFLLIDGSAALISVPTQVLVVATYGEIILDKVRQFKLVFFSIMGIMLSIWIMKRVYHFFQYRKKV